MKLLFYLAVWERPEITEICFMGLNRLKNVGLFPVEFLAVISEESMIPLCEKYGVDWCMHENLPLGRKKNFGLSQSLKKDWDYMIELGSDDLLKNELLSLYAPYFGHKQFLVIDSLVFLNSHTGACKCIPSGSRYGLGRCLSRDVVERFPDLYPGNFNQGLDKHIAFTLGRAGILETLVRSSKPLAIDIKSDLNIWSYANSLGSKYPFEDAIDGLSEQEIEAIKSLQYATA